LEARLRDELRPLAPSGTPLALRTAPSPTLCAWRGGAALATSDVYTTLAMTREEYFEQGSALRAEYERHGTRAPRGRMW
jgi:actin-related protein